jgi:alkylation response protein AidB-like acyl-CoA dehydrogenase
MDLRDTPAEAAFRKEVRDWLAANLPPVRSGEPSIDELRAWQARLNEGGWIGIAWPKEYGGRGLGLVEQAIFYQEMARVKAPSPINVIGLGMAGPTIIAHGTEAQKERHLAKILSGEEIWCQGFSEPGAGSDLAALRSTAVLDGDHYILNGQKVWTSFAHIAQWCIFMARTDPAAPKHQGISYFLLDMSSPGIEVRPLRQITGTAEFNELFLTDVRVPKENMLGEPGDGWRVAMTTLLHERGTLGFALSVAARIVLDELIETARSRGRIDDPVVRQRLAQFHVEVEALRLTSERGLSTIMRTGIPGPEGSIAKLLWSETNQHMSEFALELLGTDGLTAGPADEVARWNYQALRSRGNTIEAGTSEVLRNIIAERVLGLPRSR